MMLFSARNATSVIRFDTVPTKSVHKITASGARHKHYYFPTTGMRWSYSVCRWTETTLDSMAEKHRIVNFVDLKDRKTDELATSQKASVIE